jgi:ribosomal protein S6/ribosomal protein S18
MKKYELVLMVDPSLKQTDHKTLIDEIEVVLWSNILDTDVIGLQQLMYDLGSVAWNNRAYFVSYYLQGDAESLDAIRKALLYNKWVMRYFLFSMSNTQPFHHFEALHQDLNKVIQSREETKFWQKLTFFIDKRNAWYISRKSIPMLQKYMTRFWNIKPRKYTNNSVQTQKKLRTVILRAREMGLLHYTK